MKYLVLHGLDHDKMGKTPGKHATTMEELDAMVAAKAKELGVETVSYQNNDSKAVCEKLLGAENEGIAGVIFNPAEWMKSGEDIAEALKQIRIPVAEVHMGNTCKAPESFNVIAPAVTGLITGFGNDVYPIALELLVMKTKSN
ncbi:MAG: type II 3-dehydroquinate dehydratase [Clostridia bacterium]|nr:type II 3-dehydroquinate dehydratase [Clostridia bacterium]